MTLLLWGLIIGSFLIAYAGLVYPVIPSVLFLFLGFFVYGIGVSFEPLTWTFWVIEALFLVFLFVVDYVVTHQTVERRGGSTRARWGATLGLVVGPFLVPLVGVLIFPFVFALLAELTLGKAFREAWQIAVSTVLAFIGSAVLKLVAMTLMIAVFLAYVFIP